jgi:hypothetical protein
VERNPSCDHKSVWEVVGTADDLVEARGKAHRHRHGVRPGDKLTGFALEGRQAQPPHGSGLDAAKEQLR